MTLDNKHPIPDLSNLEHNDDAEAKNVVAYGKTNSNVYLPIAVNDDGQLRISSIEDGLKEPTGFPDGNSTAVTVSFTDGTRTYSIQPSGADYIIYHKGTKFTKTGEDTLVIADTEGIHFIYFDSDGNLQELVNPTDSQLEDMIKNEVWVASLYWDQTNSLCVYFTGKQELHGTQMDGNTHEYLHFVSGTQFLSGLAVGDVTADGTGNNDTDAQISIASGKIQDEDIEIEPSTLSIPANLPIFYKDGAAVNWRRITETNFPIDTTGTGRASWNELTGGAWQISEVTNTKFTLSHIFATNHEANPMIVVMGETEYNTIISAQQGAITEISSLIQGTMPFVEFVPIATIIFQTNNAYSNSVKSRIRTTDDGSDFIDWRFQELSAGVTPSDHGSLTGLSDDDHPQYFLVDGQSTNITNGTFDLTTTGDIAGANIIVNNAEAGNTGLILKGTGSASGSRGGFIEHYSRAGTIAGYTYTNYYNQFVWDSSAQSVLNSIGVAFVDFVDGSASFAGGDFDIDASGNITDVGSITSDSDITTSGSIISTGGEPVQTGKFLTGNAGNTVFAFSGGNWDIRAGSGSSSSQNVLRVDNSGNFDFYDGNLITTGTVGCGALTCTTINTGTGARELDQDVISGATPTFGGANITGVASVVVVDESIDTLNNILFVNQTTGTLPVKTGTNLTFNSATGLFTVTGVRSTLVEHSAALTLQAFKINNPRIVITDATYSMAHYGDVDIVDGELKGSRQCMQATLVASNLVKSVDVVPLKVGEVTMVMFVDKVSTAQGFVMQRAGSIIGLSVVLEQTAGIGFPKIELYNEAGTEIFSVSTASGAAVHNAVATQARGTDTFAAGDVYTVHLSERDGKDTVTVQEVMVFLDVQYDD